MYGFKTSLKLNEIARRSSRWNNAPTVIVEFSALQKAKWNKSTHARRHFIRHRHISRAKCISPIHFADLFHWKKHRLLPMLFHGSPSWTRTNDPAVNSRMLYRLSYWGIWKATKQDLIALWCRHRPIFPGRFQPSIFGTNELNYRVRNGNGWTLIVINTDYVICKVQSTHKLFVLLPHWSVGYINRLPRYIQWWPVADSNRCCRRERPES